MSGISKLISTIIVLLLLSGLAFAIFAFVDHSNRSSERLNNQSTEEHKDKNDKKTKKIKTRRISQIKIKTSEDSSNVTQEMLRSKQRKPNNVRHNKQHLQLSKELNNNHQWKRNKEPRSTD